MGGDGGGEDPRKPSDYEKKVTDDPPPDFSITRLIERINRVAKHAAPLGTKYKVVKNDPVGRDAKVIGEWMPYVTEEQMDSVRRSVTEVRYNYCMRIVGKVTDVKLMTYWSGTDEGK